jgi:hypothetical protein
MAEDHEDRPIEVETVGAESGDTENMMADNIPSVVKNASLMIPLNSQSISRTDDDMDFTRGEDLFD